jgi:hypothetical protein
VWLVGAVADKLREGMPTNPVIDPVGCGGEIAHGALPVPRQPN